MTRKEHIIKKLELIYCDLTNAGSHCVSHTELYGLRDKISDLCDEVSNMLDKEYEDDHNNTTDNLNNS